MEQKVFCSKFNAMLTGDMAAFGDIYNEIKTPVFTIIFRIVENRQTAEDIMQELFLRLLRREYSVPVKNPRAYIFMTARNMALDEARKKRNEELPADIPDPLDYQSAVCAGMDVESALARLSIAERDTVTLHLSAGLKFHEIAKIQNIPLGTVLSRYNSSIKKLRRMLSN